MTPHSALRLALLASMVTALAGCIFGGHPEKSEPPPAKPATPALPVHLYGGVNLNADSAGRPLALLVRIYQLRDLGAFQQIPFDTFLNPGQDRTALGSDFVDSREVLLLPNQRFDVTESLGPDTKFIGVVSLFRNPAPDRWRFAFSTKDSMASGLTLGFQSCAMTATTGAIVVAAGVDARALNRLSEVHCP